MTSVLLLSSYQVTAEENPPELQPGGGYETFGDWTIENGDEVNWSSATIIVSGNLTVRSGGSLSLENVELIMNSTVDGGLTILVEDGAVFHMESGRITSAHPSLHYNMTFKGEVELVSTEISEVWGEPETYWEHGIRIEGAPITITDCVFHSNAGAVLHVYDSDPLITESRFYSNDGMAAVFDDHSGGMFKDNYIYRQQFGVFVRYYSSTTVDSNTIYELGDAGLTYNGIRAPKAVNNSIRDCPIGMLLWYSNAYLERNDISNCQTGVHLVAESRPEIVQCTIRDSDMSGMVVNGSNVLVRNSSISSNVYDGFKIYNGSIAEILNSDISDNEDEAIQITSSFVKVNGCELIGNKGDTIYAREDSDVELFDTVIEGDPGSADFELRLESGSEIDAMDTDFDNGSVRFEDGASRLTVGIKVQFSVRDQDLGPMDGIGIRVQNETGSVRTLKTNSNGYSSRNMELYQQFDLTGDGDGNDIGEMVDRDYQYSIIEDGYLPYEETVVEQIGYLHDVKLEPEPEVHVIFNSPRSGEMDVPVDTDVLIRFDKDVDPDSMKLRIDGPGGIPVVYDLDYRFLNRTASITFPDELDHSSLYRITLEHVEGAAGEVFHGPFMFRFTTVDKPLPDNDRDGIPDELDEDDDNDGHVDTVEIYYGTDPFNPKDYPFIPPADDDDPDPDEEPVPVDDDEDIPDDVIPVDDLDDDDDPDPFDDGSGLQPVVRTDNSTSTDDGGGDPIVILVVSSLLGFLILAGTMVVILFSGRKQNTLKEDDV